MTDPSSTAPGNRQPPVAASSTHPTTPPAETVPAPGAREAPAAGQPRRPAGERGAGAEHRRRLLEAMAAAVAGKGYAATTIADVAAGARVSKRSFYEHFKDKADCLMALYLAASRNSLDTLREALQRDRDWRAQLEALMHAYLTALARNPPLLRTLFVEVMALGPAGLAVRRRSTMEIAELIVDVAGPGLSLPMAVAIVGGVHEWVLQAVEEDRVAEVPALAARSAQLVRAVIDRTA